MKTYIVGSQTVAPAMNHVVHVREDSIIRVVHARGMDPGFPIPAKIYIDGVGRDRVGPYELHSAKRLLVAAAGDSITVVLPFSSEAVALVVEVPEENDICEKQAIRLALEQHATATN